MRRCPHCRMAFPPIHRPQDPCPACGLLPAAEQEFQPIARLTSLAEVGYLADVLEAESIETAIVHHSEFDAVSGTWTTFYLLKTPAAATETAIEIVRAELEGREEVDWPEEEPSSSPGAGRSSWTPLMLVLVAGGIAYCAGRTGAERPLPTATPPLWQALRESELPLESSSPGGQVRRRLRFDPAGDALLLEEFDPRGRLERTRAFSPEEVR